MQLLRHYLIKRNFLWVFIHISYTIIYQSTLFLPPDATEKTQDPSNSSEEKHKFVSPCQATQFHPQIFPCSILGRKHHWNHTNAACLPNRPRTFPETPEAWVECASKCVNTQCCGYFHRKLEEPTSCLCCLTSQKFLSDVTQLPVPLWHRNMNYDSSCPR